MKDGDRETWIGRFTQVKSGEIGSLVLSAGCFFFVMFGYFLLRPLREAMGVQRSMKDLQWLFLITCGVSLLVSLAFGGLVSKVDRKRFIAIAFRLVMGCLLVFAVLLSIDAGEQFRLYTGYVFYVWLSVINLFIVSVFWGLMADLWTLGQGKRLFAVIGIGGTLGALLSSNFTWWLVDTIGPTIQMIIAVVLFELAVQCVIMLDRRAGKEQSCENSSEILHHADQTVPGSIGGQWWDGVRAISRSPYLLGIGMYIVMLAISNTLIYFTQADLVRNEAKELGEQIALFAQLDMWTQLATLLVQLFVTGHLIRRLGVGVALSMLPIVTIAGFMALAYVSKIDGIEGWKVFGVLAVFSAIHRATRYAIIRPARETLFSVVPTSEKYKAKPIIDGFLYRGGDIAGAGLTGVVGGLSAMVFFTAPLTLLWGGLAVALAMSQQRRAQSARLDRQLENEQIDDTGVGDTGIKHTGIKHTH